MGNTENIVEIGIKIRCSSNESAEILQKASVLAGTPTFQLTVQEYKPAAMSHYEFRDIRKKAKLNQEVYSDELGLSQGYVSELERGDKPITEEIAQTARDVLVKYTKPKENK